MTLNDILWSSQRRMCPHNIFMVSWQWLFVILTMMLQTLCNDVLCCHHNDFMCPHNYYMWHHDTLWSSQWLVCLNMIVCDLHSNFCVLSQGISVLHEFLSHTMSLCPLTMNLCVLKMTVCDLTITMCALILALWLSQLLWAFQITCVPSQ